MAKSADRYFGLDEFKIVEKGFDTAYELEAESIFSIANEHMGIRGYFEEGGTQQSMRGSYLGGVYETQPHQPESEYLGFVKQTHYMVTAADALATTIQVGNETLQLNKCKCTDFMRVLDMRTGLLLRHFVWYTNQYGRVEVTLQRMVSMDRPELLAQKISLCALDMDAEGTLTLAADGNIVHQNTGKCLWKDCTEKSEEALPQLMLCTASTETDVRYSLQLDKALEWNISHSQRKVEATAPYTLKRGQSLHIERCVAVQVARDGETMQAVPAMLPFDDLLAENQNHWQLFWNDCDVQIEGDVENQQGIRYCLFQLHSTYRGLSPFDNIGAKGLTGEAYNGHAFWDTETYCLPFYLLNDPSAARSLLRYRYQTLPQARERANQLGLKGACYPIATLDGTEACTLWQHSSLQMQPATAVAYAIQTYVQWTHDTDFLQQEGAEMLVEIARYVLSRGGWNEEGFGFYGVMGPDEFHMMVNNDFYTNFMGKKTLLYAADCVQRLAGKHRERLLERTGLLDHEANEWLKAANAMLFTRREDGVFEQHDGYFRMPHTDVHAIPQDEFPLYSHWSYDRIYRTDMLKQPAVLMAMFLYPDDFSMQGKAANYEYYEPRCIHESSLSPSVHAIIASQLGLREDALHFFGFATRLDLDNYNRNTREGLHLSSVAAAWVTIVEGFGGVCFHGGELSLAPWLPEGWTRFTFAVRMRNGLLRVSVDEAGVTLQCEGAEVVVMVYGKAVTASQQERRVSRPEGIYA